MKFFISGLGNFDRTWKLAEQAVPVADELGFYGVVLPDHYMWDWQDMPNRNSTLDAWLMLTYLAAKTRNLKLATLVTPIPFRPPGILAKMVATLDYISSGRAVLGVGAGWSRSEFDGYSEWSEPKVRVDKTEEGVRLILKLWQEPRVDFQGKFYKANGAIIEPKPVRKPHPPLLFGGVSKRMLRLAGRYGDYCFIPPWTQNMTFNQAKETVEKEAVRMKRRDKISFGAGSPRAGERFDLKAIQKDIETSEENGCKFYIVAFPHDDYENGLREFARDVLPSYSKEGRLVAPA